MERTLAIATGDPVAAEDATQEAFARTYRRWAHVEAMDRPVGWVYVVAMNVVRRAKRRDARGAELSASLVGRVEVTDPATSIVDSVALAGALRTLAPRQREALVLRYLADLSVEETARAMRCAPGTVKSATHAALDALRIRLDDEPDPEPAGVHHAK
jgi:RNA polymerase sigma factor (sigma-70 family)